MAIGITGKFKPKGDFPLIDAKDVEMPDGTRLSEYKFESDATEVVLLEEQDVDWFSLDSTYGYAAAFDPSPFTMAVGETYRIMWDEQEFNVTAQDASALMEGAIFAGNGTDFGLDGNNEPFIVGYVNGILVFSAFTDPAESHKIGVYQTIKKPVLPPVTAADNSKILQVVNGVWTATDAFVPISQADYDSLVAAGTVDATKYYMIVGDGE